MTASAPSSRQRVDWVDYAKGFCICFVVMMHSTLGVEQALGQQGWMHALVAFAKPFRMPDFFMISGLFLAQVIDRDWRTYADRKVAHFAYFYVLWTAIQLQRATAHNQSVSEGKVRAQRELQEERARSLQQWMRVQSNTRSQSVERIRKQRDQAFSEAEATFTTSTASAEETYQRHLTEIEAHYQRDLDEIAHRYGPA